MTIVFERSVPQGGTHALVFGVGHFPFLNGSNTKLPTDLRQVDNVTSPPNNAFAMVDWLIEARDDLLPPLASIELLVSPEDGSQATYDSKQPNDDPRASSAVDAATGAKYFAATGDWLNRAESNPDNVAIFYGSSHGFQGQEHVLLLEDAGESELDPWQNMVSIDHVSRNLYAKGHARSVVFADCCRNLLESSTQSIDPISGRRIGNVTANELAQRMQDRERAVYVLRASPFGDQTEATKHGLGYFTEALLLCFRGATGSTSAEVPGWSIRPSILREAVRQAGLYGLNHDVDPRDDGSHWVGLPLVRLHGKPKYPVRVQPRDESLTDFVDLNLVNANTGYTDGRPATNGAKPLSVWVEPTFDPYEANGYNQMSSTPLQPRSFTVVSEGSDIYLEVP